MKFICTTTQAQGPNVFCTTYDVVELSGKKLDGGRRYVLEALYDNNFMVGLVKDCFSLDILLVPKISKRHFFRDISNSCQWVTQMGLEPHQKNFFLKNF